jgi:hypothetical protein
MKIHSNLRAGMTFAECDAQRNRMKWAAQSGDCSALNSYATQLPSYPVQPSYPTQLPSYPVQPSYPTQLPSYPPAYYPPSQPVQGGGYYGGVWYGDRSGTCG